MLVAADGRVRVADFGVASMASLERLTRTGQLLGTPSFMAPEQVSGAPAAPGMDVWALGVLLYEALTGARPFAEERVEMVFARIGYGEITPPRELAPGVSRALEAVCLHALDRDPSARYADASAFADDLARALRGERPEGALGSASPLVRVGRRAAWAAPLVVGLAALGVAAGVGPPDASRSTAGRDRSAAGSPPPTAGSSPTPTAPAASAEPEDGFAATLRGVDALERGDPAEAERAFTRALERWPGSASAALGRATARERSGDLAGALADAERAAEVAPEDAAAHERVGRLRVTTGDLRGGVAACSSAVTLDPERAGAWRQRGLGQLRLGRVAEAIDDFTRAIALEPDHAMAYGYDPAGAEGDATRALALGPDDDPRAFTIRSEARRRTGDAAGALADAERAVELAPDDALAVVARARALAAAGDVAGARRDYERARALAPPDGATARAVAEELPRLER